VIGAIAVVSALRIVAQDRTSPQFRAGVEVVLLDVAVIERNRVPIRSLRASDFTVFEEGSPRRIVSVDEIRSIWRPARVQGTSLSSTLPKTRRPRGIADTTHTHTARADGYVEDPKNQRSEERSR
jgi:hypothetical protein